MIVYVIELVNIYYKINKYSNPNKWKAIGYLFIYAINQANYITINC